MFQTRTEDSRVREHVQQRTPAHVRTRRPSKPNMLACDSRAPTVPGW